MKPRLKPRSNPSLAPHYFPMKMLFHLEMCLIFMKIVCKSCCPALRIFWNCQNITEDNRRQIASVSLSLSLSIIHSPAPTNFTFSVRLRVFKALLWDARDRSPKRNVEAAWPFSSATRILKWRASIGKQPTSSNAKIPNFSQH